MVKTYINTTKNMALSLDKDLKFACEGRPQRATAWELLWKEKYETLREVINVCGLYISYIIWRYIKYIIQLTPESWGSGHLPSA